MASLKLITPHTVSLQMFNTLNPTVDGVDKSPVLVLTPNEVINEDDWLVTDLHDSSYNAEILNAYISKHILTRIP